MADVKQCDRCKNVYKEKNNLMIQVDGCEFKFGHIRLMSVKNNTICEIDLCEDCIKEFLHWVGPIEGVKFE